MKLIVASLAIVLAAFAFAPHPHALADGVCNAPSPTASSSALQPFPAVSTPPAIYVLTACATVNGHVYSFTNSLVGRVPVDPAGCYMIQKMQHAAFISSGPHWSSSCAVKITVQTARTVGSAG